jgi:GNAT superfamily N-acetyltransferase
MREATIHDKMQIMEMMVKFRDESGFNEFMHFTNESHFFSMLDNIFAGQGIIYIEENKGLLMAMVLPSIWCNKTYGLHELAWFVLPEYRNTTIGYRLFKAYIAYAKKLKTIGRIKYFTMTKLDNSANFDYAKYGFTKKDENWVQ